MQRNGRELNDIEVCSFFQIHTKVATHLNKKLEKIIDNVGFPSEPLVATQNIHATHTHVFTILMMMIVTR